MNTRKITRNPSNYYNMKSLSSLSSCFLTPESAEKPTNVGRLTPTFDQTSSVFLSPPASSERKTVPNFAAASQKDPLKLELDFKAYESENIQGDRSPAKRSRTPLLSEVKIIGSTIGSDEVDFIVQLLQVNCDQICKIICGFLSDHDLCRFAGVSRSWRSFIRNNSQLQERRKTYLQQKKQYCIQKGKENLGSPSSLKDSCSTTPSTRTPLATLNIELSQRLPSRTTRSLATSQTPSTLSPRTPATGTYRPCPKCSAPSLINVHAGYCHCQRCDLKYCSKCLRDMSQHKERDCNGLEQPQERRERKTRQRRKAMGQVVGSRQSKENIRRL